MYANPNQYRGSFDGYDLWRLISYAGTALSVVGLFTQPKLSSDLGKTATFFGLASITHAAVSPPRCSACSSRMIKSATSYPDSPQWTCTCGSVIYPST